MSIFIVFINVIFSLAPSSLLNEKRILTKEGVGFELFSQVHIEMIVPLLKDSKGNRERIHKLMDQNKGIVNEQDDQGNTLLHHAIELGDCEWIKDLIDHYSQTIDMKIKNKKGEMALALALKKKEHNIGDLLIENMMKEESVKTYHRNIVNVLYQNSVSQFKWVLSYMSSCKEQFSEEEIFQVVNGLDLHFVRRYKRDFLEWCLENKFYDYFLDLFYRIKKNGYSEYILKMAQKGHIEALQYLIINRPYFLFQDEHFNREQEKDDVLNENWEYLMSIMTGDLTDQQITQVKNRLLLIKREDLKRINEQGHNLLAQALIEGQSHIFKLLNERFGPFNKKDFILDNYGRGPLIQAVQGGCLELFILLKKQFKIDQVFKEKDQYGETVIMKCVTLKRKEILQYILNTQGKEISVTTQNQLQEDALMMALSKGFFDIYELLFPYARGMTHHYYLMKMIKKDNVKAVKKLLPYIKEDDFFKEDEQGLNIFDQSIFYGSTHVYQVLKESYFSDKTKDFFILPKNKEVAEQWKSRLLRIFLKNNKEKILNLSFKLKQFSHELEDTSLNRSSYYTPDILLEKNAKILNEVEQDVLQSVREGQNERVYSIFLIQPELRERQVYEEALLLCFLLNDDKTLKALIQTEVERVGRMTLESLYFPWNNKFVGWREMVWEDAFEKEDIVVLRYMWYVMKINCIETNWSYLVEAVQRNKRKVLQFLRVNKGKRYKKELREAILWSFKKGDPELIEMLIVGDREQSILEKNMKKEVENFQKYIREEKRRFCQPYEIRRKPVDCLTNERALMCLPFYSQLSRDDRESFVEGSKESFLRYEKKFEIYKSFLIQSSCLTKESLKTEKDLLDCLKSKEKFYLRGDSSHPDFLKKNKEGVDLLMYCSYKGWLRVVRYLFETYKVSLERIDNQGCSSLFYLFMGDYILEVIEFFDMKGSVYIQYFKNIIDNQGMDFLMYMTSQGFLKMALLLLEMNEDAVIYQTPSGFSAMTFLMNSYHPNEKRAYLKKWVQKVFEIKERYKKKEKDLLEKIKSMEVEISICQNQSFGLLGDNSLELKMKKEELTQRVLEWEEKRRKEERKYIILNQIIRMSWVVSVSLNDQQVFDLFLEKLEEDLKVNQESCLWGRQFNDSIYQVIEVLFFYKRTVQIERLKAVLINCQNKRNIVGIPSLIGALKGYGSFFDNSLSPYLYSVCLSKDVLYINQTVSDGVDRLCNEGIGMERLHHSAKNVMDVICLHWKSIENPFALIERIYKEALELNHDNRRNTKKEDELIESLMNRLISWNIHIPDEKWEKLFGLLGDYYLKYKMYGKYVEKFGKVLAGFSSFETAELYNVQLKDLFEKKASQSIQQRMTQGFEDFYKDAKKYPHWFYVDKNGDSPLMSVLRSGSDRLRKFQHVLPFSKNWINYQDKEGKTILMRVIQEWKKLKEVAKEPAKKEKSEDLIRMMDHLLLFLNQINFSLKDNQGKTVWHYAIEAQAIEMFKLLVQKGGALDLESSCGQSYFGLALTHCHPIAHYLLSIYPFLSENSGGSRMTPLRYGVLYDKYEWIEVLGEYGKGVLEKQFESQTVLDEALRSGKTKMAILLHQLGVPLGFVHEKEDLEEFKEELYSHPQWEGRPSAVSLYQEMDRRIRYLSCSA